MSSQEEQIIVKTGKVKVNDINMYYEIHGEGFPLVMIMGYGASFEYWNPKIIDEFSKNFKVIVFDNRGSGRTDKPDKEYSIKMFADDTTGLMDALNIERAHILGHSMGGMIAQEIVLNYPERVEKLILSSTSCGGRKYVPPSTEIALIAMRDREGMKQDEIVRSFIPLRFTEDFIKNNPEFIEEQIQREIEAPFTPAYSIKRQGIALVQFNTSKRLKNINTPTLVLHGKKDIMTPTKNGEILAELIPGAKLSLFDNSGHETHFHEPKKYVKTVLEFLK